MHAIVLRKQGDRIVAQDGTVVVTREPFGLRIHLHGRFGYIETPVSTAIQLVDTSVQTGQALGTLRISGTTPRFRGRGHYVDWLGEFDDWSFTPAGLQ